MSEQQRAKMSLHAERLLAAVLERLGVSVSEAAMEELHSMIFHEMTRAALAVANE